MPFPSSFYKSKNQVQLQRTTVPTGMLGNPLDLVNHPRPWLTVNTAPETKDIPKTLIFADHFFDKRQNPEKWNTKELIKNAKNKGFNILHLTPDGTLVPWVENRIDDYKLDIKKFTEEKIRELAWEQKKLGADSIFVLDHFGVNELLGAEKNAIAPLTFWQATADLAQLLLQTQRNPIKISGMDIINIQSLLDLQKQLDPPKTFELNLVFPKKETLALLNDAKTIKTVAPQIKSIKVLKNPDFVAQYSALLHEAKQLEKIETDDLNMLLDEKSPLQRTQLKSLKLILKPDEKIDEYAMNKLLAAAPNLTELIIEGGIITDKKKSRRPYSEIEQPHRLKTIHLIKVHYDIYQWFTPFLEHNAKNLENFTMREGKMAGRGIFCHFSLKAKRIELIKVANTLLGTLHDATNAEEISLAQCEIKDAFKSWKKNSLPKLASVNLSNTDVTAASVEALCAAAPNLQMLDLSLCQNIGDALKNLEANSLSSLKFVNLNNANIRPEDIRHLSRVAPNLKVLTIMPSRDREDILSQKRPFWNSSFPQIKELFLDNFGLIEFSNLQDILNGMPNLEKLSLSAQNIVAADIPQSPLNPLKKLNDLRIIAKDDENGDPKLIAALLEAAPQLEKLNIDWYPAKAIFNQLRPGALRHLKLIKLHEPLDDDTSEALFQVAPQLTLDNIEFPNKEKIIKKQIQDKPKTLDTKPLSHIDNQQKNLDPDFFNTGIRSLTLGYTKYFPKISPSNYRLNVWHPKLNTLEGYSYQQFPDDFKAIPIQPAKTYLNSASFICHQGVKPVIATDGAQIVLPSLDPEEHLFNVKIIDKSGNSIPPQKIEHSPSIQFHRITLPAAGEYAIHFEVAIPSKKAKLPAKLDDLYTRYNAFTAKDNDSKESFKDLKAFAAHIRNNKTGYCIQRAIAAYDELQAEYKENVRIAINDTHAYIEVNVDKEWHKIDLGGYPAKLEEHKVETHATKADEKKATTPHDDSKATLIQITSATDLQEVLKDAKSIFIAHNPADLSLTAPSMTEDGVIKPAHTRFKQWLDDYKQGTIYVDMRDFEDNEIAQLNDLLDRKIEEKVLPKEINIKLIDRPDRQYGPDFRRRVPVRTTVAASDRTALLPEATPDAKDALVIDLFHSPYWQRLLIGTWKLKNTDEKSAAHSFYWEKGELLKAILDKDAKHQEIVFKNPPLHDPTFTTFVAELNALRKLEWADQTTAVPSSIRFTQTNGYDWPTLNQNASTYSLTTETKEAPYVLSNTNILSFIQNPCYAFDKTRHQLEAKPGYLEQHRDRSIDIVCTPGVSEGTQAELLTHAKKQNVQIRFLIPTTSSPTVNWEIHDDVYYATRKLLNEHPNACYVDMSCLTPSELGYYPLLTEADRKAFLASGKLSMQATLSDILQKLKKGETVILAGKIPPTLYSELTTLSLGYIDGERFGGKLIILTSPEKAAVVQAITRKTHQLISTPSSQKMKLLTPAASGWIGSIDDKKEMVGDFATLEREFLQQELTKDYKKPGPYLDNNDEKNADLFDQDRLMKVQAALSINPWVMIPGATGIGKSHFLQHVIPQEYVCKNLKDWLDKKAEPGKPAILVIDEASFATELSGAGDNFLERFKSLRNNPPGFYLAGKYHELTQNHKVIFAFNPESYGAGRKTAGFLTEHALDVSFATLPYFYVRARLIKPLLAKLLKKSLSEDNANIIAGPIEKVYNYIVANSPQQEVLITPRHIKFMLNLIVSQMTQYDITDKQTLTRLAEEVAFMVGRQTLIDHADKTQAFEEKFTPAQSVLTRKLLPRSLLPYQHEIYSQIHHILEARKTLTKDHTDLGLGGIILEGASGIGKTHFIKELTSHVPGKIYRISPTTPYQEKEKLLKEAFANGALVIAEEINTSLWPNKLLNNFLMGLDEEGKPAKNPGFMLLATQNPPSFAGRSEEDPAVRQRILKLKIDWPAYQATSEKLMFFQTQPTMEEAKTLDTITAKKFSATNELLKKISKKTAPEKFEKISELADKLYYTIHLSYYNIRKNPTGLFQVLRLAVPAEISKDKQTALSNIEDKLNECLQNFIDNRMNIYQLYNAIRSIISEKFAALPEKTKKDQLGSRMTEVIEFIDQELKTLRKTP